MFMKYKDTWKHILPVTFPFEFLLIAIEKLVQMHSLIILGKVLFHKSSPRIWPFEASVRTDPYWKRFLFFPKSITQSVCCYALVHPEAINQLELKFHQLYIVLDRYYSAVPFLCTKIEWNHPSGACHRAIVKERLTKWNNPSK